MTETINYEQIQRTLEFDENADYLNEDFINNLEIFEFSSNYIRNTRRETIFNFVLPEINVIYKKNELLENENNIFDCSICIENHSTDFVELNCSHKYCFECIQSYLKHTLCDKTKVPNCALCREKINNITISDEKKVKQMSELLDEFV